MLMGIFVFLYNYVSCLIIVDEIGEFFMKKDVPKLDASKKSLLSVQLEQVSPISDNPFISYAKYDGRVSKLLN